MRIIALISSQIRVKFFWFILFVWIPLAAHRVFFMQRFLLLSISLSQWVAHILKIYVFSWTQAHSGKLIIYIFSFINSSLCLINLHQLFIFLFSSLRKLIILNYIHALLVFIRDLSFSPIFKSKVVFIHMIILFFKLINIIIVALIFGIN
jgi:hypothetical protein